MNTLTHLEYKISFSIFLHSSHSLLTLSRSARELLLEVTCERERGWVGPQLSQKTDNQPQAFFQEVPQGQKVLRPVPIPGSTTGVGSPSTPGTLFAQQQQQPQVQESSRQLQVSLVVLLHGFYQELISLIYSGGRKSI